MIRIFTALLLVVMLFASAGCSDSSSSTSAPPISEVTGPFTVSGSVNYEDVEYGPTGQNGKTTMKPVRLAVVDLQDASGAVLATVTTDQAGKFQFSAVTKTPATLRVLAEATTPLGTKVTVRYLNGEGRLATYYDLVGQDLAQPVTVDIVRDASQIAGIFNMLDVYLSGLEYANTQFTPAKLLPPLDIYWPNTLGSYTCPAFGDVTCEMGPGIYVLSDWQADDQDHYDDDVLWHELAHYLEFSQGVSDSPGGWHTFADNTLDLTLSWSEGQADYFQMAVKRWLLANHPERLSIPPASPVTYYVDTSWDGNILAALDLANPGDAPYVYATNEVAVAKTLWNTSQGYGESAVWSAWMSYMPVITYRASSLETFWDGLLQAGLTAGQLLPLFNERLINYSADSHEFDDSVGTRSVVDCTLAGTCINENHTLYQPALVAGMDIVPLKVSAGLTYTIATGNLTNGADTFLRLLDANGNVLTMPDGITEISSDDIPGVVCANGEICNNGSNFSSRILYTAPADGILNVELSNAPYAFEVAGAYGGYTLTVTAK